MILEQCISLGHHVSDTEETICNPLKPFLKTSSSDCYRAFLYSSQFGQSSKSLLTFETGDFQNTSGQEWFKSVH